MARISTYPIDSTPKVEDYVIGTEVENLDVTKNYRISDILALGEAGTVTSINIAGDSTTGDAITDNGTFTFLGTGGITTSVVGTTLTIDGSGAGGFANWVLSADSISGTNTVSNGETASFLGGPGIFTTLVARDTTLKLDINSLAAVTATASDYIAIQDVSTAGNESKKALISDIVSLAGGVLTVDTTNGSFIDLTPISATSGNVVVTADLSALDGTEVAGTRFLSKNNKWAVPASSGSSGVTSINTTTGGPAITATPNTPTSGAVTIDIQGGGLASQVILGDLTLGTLNLGTLISVTPQANGTDGTPITTVGNINFVGAGTVTTSISGDTVTITGSGGGGGGTVTEVAALTLGTIGTDLTSTVANGTSTPVITLNVPTASAVNRGALSAADWTTFNNKGTVTAINVAGDSTTGTDITTNGTFTFLGTGNVTTSVSGKVVTINGSGGGGSGTVTSVDTDAGLVLTGTATDPIISVNYTNTSTGLFTSAGAAVTPVGTDYILISDTSNSGNVVKALISDLPSGGGGSVTIVSSTFAGTAFTSTVTDPSSTPAIDITANGAATDYINGLGNLVVFPSIPTAYTKWKASGDNQSPNVFINITDDFDLRFTGQAVAGAAGAGIATDSAINNNQMSIGLIETGGTASATTFYRGDGQWATPGGSNITYDLASAQDVDNVNITLTDSNNVVDTVQLIAGTGISLTDDGINNITIDVEAGNNGAFVPIGTLANSDIYNANFNSAFPTARSVIIGDNSMSSDTLASLEVHGRVSQIIANNNTFFGKFVGANNTGSGNVAFGYEAFKENLAGHTNSAFGQYALKANTSGWGNTAIGQSALISNTIGVSNTAIGSLALTDNVDGVKNTAIGHSALQSNVSGSENISIGYLSLANNTGDESVVIGNRAFTNNPGISTVVGIGHEVGRYANAQESVMIGNRAGTQKAVGGNFSGTCVGSIFIGHDTRPSVNSSSNEIIIGTDAIGKGDNTVVLGNDNITETHLKGVVVLEGYLYADLPASPVVGMRTYRKDAPATGTVLYGTAASAIPTGPGILPIFYDGTNWIYA